MEKNVGILSVSGVKIQEISRASKYVLIEWYFSKNNDVNERMLLVNWLKTINSNEKGNVKKKIIYLDAQEAFE